MSNPNELSKDFIAKQRLRLVALRAELLGSEAAALKDVAELQDVNGDEAKEYEDVAQTMERKEVLQAKHDVDLQRLGAIDRALKKIDSGSYGLSDLSGLPIPKARLEATPEAVLTVEEAAAKE